MRLADALLDALKAHGATEVFGIPGDFALAFFEAIEENETLPLYTLSHEPAVGFAADAAARSNCALGVAAVAHRLLSDMPFPSGYGAIVLLGAVLLYVSSFSFVSSGEPIVPVPTNESSGFVAFMREGVQVFRVDHHFRLFVYSQWLGGAVMMALPFYILQAIAFRAISADVAFLLGAQTAGALASNALWGWWGDRFGKHSLLEGVALLRTAPPLLTLVWVPAAATGAVPALAGFAVVFFLLGAFGSGITIAMIGYLMEISPDDRRPAYSGYFNALVAPAALLPLAGAAIAAAMSLTAVFAVSMAAAIVQYLVIRRLRHLPAEEGPA